MSFGTLIFAGLTRNPLRYLFTFAAIAAAFCLFGVLETLRYQRDTPLEDERVIAIQGDAPGGFPLDYEATLRGMPGVASATGLVVVPSVNPKSSTGSLMLFGLDAAQTPATFPGMRIPQDIAKRWAETRIGAILYAPIAQELGWKPGDHLTIQLRPGFLTASGANQLEVDLIGVYPGRSIFDGLLVHGEYLREAFPFMQRFANLFVRPAPGGDARELAGRIDEHFSSGPAKTVSAQIFDSREAAARDAATIRFVIRGALVIAFFTMVLIVANAITQSVRERMGEMAVMQALGFQQRTILLLVFAEVVALVAAGAIVGLLLANAGLRSQLAAAQPNAGILPLHTISWAAVYAMLFAAIAALLPGWELSRLRVADALRRL